MRWISTRQYSEALPAMASTWEVSKSNVSRDAEEESEAARQELLGGAARRWISDRWHTVRRAPRDHAVGVDRAGHKRVLGIQSGARENAAVVEDLLQQLVARGVNPQAKRLFVIDGAKALRAALSKVFGSQHPVQRCRNHKIRNRGRAAARGAEGPGGSSHARFV
jgi:transposase-like protein